jgi:hypothetical protein
MSPRGRIALSACSYAASGGFHLTRASTDRIVEAPGRTFNVDHAAVRHLIRLQRDEGSGDSPVPGRQWHDDGQQVIALLDLLTCPHNR